MDIIEIELTPEDEKWCRRWANRYSNIIVSLTDEYSFNEIGIAKLIKFEVTHARRIDLLDRLMARYSKLRRRREWSQLIDFMETTSYGK